MCRKKNVQSNLLNESLDNGSICLMVWSIPFYTSNFLLSKICQLMVQSANTINFWWWANPRKHSFNCTLSNTHPSSHAATLTSYCQSQSQIPYAASFSFILIWALQRSDDPLPFPGSMGGEKRGAN